MFFFASMLSLGVLRFCPIVFFVRFFLFQAVIAEGADPLRKSANGQRPFEIALSAKREYLYESFAPKIKIKVPAEIWVKIEKSFGDYFRSSYKILGSEKGIEPPPLEYLLTLEKPELGIKFEVPNGGLIVKSLGFQKDGFTLTSEEYLGTNETMKTLFKITPKGFTLQ